MSETDEDTIPFNEGDSSNGNRRGDSEIEFIDTGGYVVGKALLRMLPDAPVIVCDSQKSWRAARVLFSGVGYVVVYLRGVLRVPNLTREIDFSIFAGRDVIYLQTNTFPAKQVWEKVQAALPYARLLDPPELKEEPGLDANDIDVSDSPEEWLAKNLPPKPPPSEKPALTLRYGFDTTTAQPLGTVVDGLLHSGSVSLFYGPPKSGKSFLITDLALTIAAAQRAWMGHEIVRSGPVLVIACEGHAGYWKQVVAAAKERGWSKETFPKGFILATGRPTLIRTDARGFTFAPDPSSILAALADAKQKGLKPVAIFIDTVFRSIGAGNVNASPDMNAYLAAIATLTDQGFAVGLVHHEIKSGGTPAGSVALIGGSDDVVHVWRESQDSEQRFWQVDMAKDDAETQPRAFTLDVVPIGRDPDGRPVSSCVIRDAGAAPDAKKKRGRPPGQSAAADFADLIYRELVNLLADSREPLQEASPKFPYGSIDRSRLRVTINKAGILVTPGPADKPGRVEATNRQRVSKALNTLKNRQKIIMDDRSIGLPKATDRGVTEIPEPIS